MRHVAFLFLVFTACSPGRPPEDEHAAVSEIALTDQGAVMRVKVPENHHAYLDSGPEGSFIPVAADWAALVKAGSLERAPDLASAPAGTLDKDSGAKVLRGTGEFVFKGNLKSLAGKTVQVRTQVCDDLKGICYRPRIQDVTLR